MKQKMMLCLSLLIGVYAYSQSKFQKGYIVKSTGDKIECLIQNENWENTPDSFKYKINENSPVLTGDLTNTKEFSIEKRFKYLRFTIKNNAANFRLKNDLAFLKVLVEADQLSLFEFIKDDKEHFFYKKGKGSITLLRYSRLVKSNGEVVENNDYKKQLSDNLFANCENLSLDIPYNKYKLGNYVIAYNNCNRISKSLIDYREYELRGEWKLKAKVGANISSINVINRTGPSGESKNTNIRFGIEIEHFLKLKNKNWSIFAEPTYTSFKDNSLVIEYNSFELPFGIRNYISLSKSSHLFLNTGLSMDISGTSKIGRVRLETGLAIFYGAGYSFNKKLSLETRMYTKRALAPKSNNLLEADQTNFALILGYTFN